MKSFRQVTFTVISIISIILIALSILSLIQNVSLWYIQILDFPRIQFLVTGIVCLVIIFITINKWTIGKLILTIGIIISIGIQIVILFPYTPFSSKEISSVGRNDKQDDMFSILVANVWMKNANSSAFLKVIDKNDPDLIITLEVNSRWINDLKGLENQYPYTVKRPYDNTYGMALYSKLPLVNTQVLYLNHPNVPSIHTQVQLNKNKMFNLHAVHPVPPKPSSHPDNVGEKEVALVKVGAMTAKEESPSVVAGDFNDVAWSKTSRLFKNNGKLNDIRVGRGFFNSFDATSWIMRWPLDHVYVTNEFKVVDVKRLSKFGSDHFPYFVKLSL